MKRRILIALFLLTSIFIVSACSFGGNTTNPTEPTTKDEAYKVEFYDEDGTTLISSSTLKLGETIVFPKTEEKNGKYFVCWLQNGKEFKLGIMPSSDIKLVAKYEEGYRYTFVDYDDSIIFEGFGSLNSEITVPNNPVREKEGNLTYTFNGWDKEIKPLTENVTYKATYTSKKVFTVTYELNGGNFNYYSYDDVVKDLLNDYNRFSGKSYTVGSLGTGSWELINFHSFFYSGNNKAKWSWLAEYLGEVASSANRKACRQLTISKSADEINKVNDNYKYSISYEFRAFIKGIQLSSNPSFVTADYSDYDIQNRIWEFYQSEIEKSKYRDVDASKPKIALVNPYKLNHEFAGWYDNAEFTGTPYTMYDVTEDVVLYAKFIELDPVTSITINNSVNEMEKFTALKLDYTVNPGEVKNKAVKFKSSNSKVLTVDSTGNVTALQEGEAVITITSILTPSVVAVMNVSVYTPDHFIVSYESESYMNIGDTISLNAEYVKKDKTNGTITWESLNSDIATVNNGVVTGVSKGVATIRAIADSDATKVFDFKVTVLESDLSSVAQQIIDAHNSNVFVKYDLGIGAGTPVYYADVIGSVSKLLFEEYEVNDKYYASQQSNSKNHGGVMSSTEFITVHYTGNMAATADAAANANYFATNSDVSIHYTTGNDGIFYILDEKYVGYHAGDSTNVKFTWSPTGVMVQDGDPEKVVFGISSDSFFTINGRKTSIVVPTGTTEATKKVTDSRWINDMGLSYKVVDGEYYMGTTWWCYSQIAEGRICSKGGNLNSIGIESCVNKGSDLWYTWQKTAKLVADIMVRQNLDITRVVGHHFFSAKDCPQPLLENDLEIWKEFIKLVEVEYEMMTTFKDYEISIEVISGNVDTKGRVKQGRYAENITYKVTINNTLTNTSEVITLSSCINGNYTK